MNVDVRAVYWQKSRRDNAMLEHAMRTNIDWSSIPARGDRLPGVTMMTGPARIDVVSRAHQEMRAKVEKIFRDSDIVTPEQVGRILYEDSRSQWRIRPGDYQRWGRSSLRSLAMFAYVREREPGKWEIMPSWKRRMMTTLQRPSFTRDIVELMKTRIMYDPTF